MTSAVSRSASSRPRGALRCVETPPERRTGAALA